MEDGGNITVFSCDCMCKPFASSPSFCMNSALCLSFSIPKLYNDYTILYTLSCVDTGGGRHLPTNVEDKSRSSAQLVGKLKGHYH